MKKGYIGFLLILLLVNCTSSAMAQSLAGLEDEVLTRLGNLEKWSSYGDSHDEDKLEAENLSLKTTLIRIAKRKDTLSYPFSKITEKMQVSTSPDGKFRIYSWDTESGGTMHDFESVFQYLGKDGRSHYWTFPEREEFSVGGFYHQIFQVKTNMGNVYLANSTFMLSTANSMQALELYRIDGSRLNPKLKLIRTKTGLKDSISFEYDFFSVFDHPERPIKLVFYDDSKKLFRIPVVVEDSKFANGGKVTDKFIEYKFNGTYFVKIK